MAERAFLLSLAGPVLTPLLEDAQVTDVCCNDNGTAFVRRLGEGKHQVAHPGFAVLDRFLAAIAHEVGAEWRAESPRLSAALEDVGWRIQAARPPATPAPFMALRKHPAHVFPLEALEAQGVLTAQQRTVLAAAAEARKRVVIVGGVGSSKTTLLNSLLHQLRDTPLRVVLLEDDPEILCQIQDCTRMWRVRGQFGLREMVQDSLRLNPDLLIIGEVRDGAALDMLKAFQTGHGGMTTLHVDNPEDALLRLEQLVQEVSVDPQRMLIGTVVDLVVHMTRTATAWGCTGIVEVERWDGARYLTRRVA